MMLFGYWVNQLFTCLLANKANSWLDKLSLDNHSNFQYYLNYKFYTPGIPFKDVIKFQKKKIKNK